MARQRLTASRCIARPMADEPVSRYALKIAYDGTKFWGTNPQPEHRSVHSEIRRALHADKVELSRPGIPFAGRTDKGVSALGNCIALDVIRAKRIDQFVPSLNAELEDCAIVGAAEVPPSFHPRKASMRVYRYAMPDDPAVDLAVMAEAGALFGGTHNFQGFARRDKKRHGLPNAYTSTIEGIAVERTAGCIFVTIRGSRFWWNQVRRMVPALAACARGECTQDDLAGMLTGGPAVKAALKPAPPEPLLLLDVEYAGVEFARKSAWLRPKQGWLRRLTHQAAGSQAFTTGLAGLLA
jgi:tRNA pseudouridine38-40 synthase